LMAGMPLLLSSCFCKSIYNSLRMDMNTSPDYASPNGRCGSFSISRRGGHCSLGLI
jgi:hypothetical protein